MTLSELIASEPANAARTDAEVLAWLRESVSVVGSIPSRKLVGWAAANGRLAKLRAAASDPVRPEAVRSVADAAVLTITRTDTEIDMADPNHVALLDVLVDSGVFAPADKAELLVLATTTAPRWDFGDIHESDALRQIAGVR